MPVKYCSRPIHSPINSHSKIKAGSIGRKRILGILPVYWAYFQYTGHTSSILGKLPVFGIPQYTGHTASILGILPVCWAYCQYAGQTASILGILQYTGHTASILDTLQYTGHTANILGQYQYTLSFAVLTVARRPKCRVCPSTRNIKSAEILQYLRCSRPSIPLYYCSTGGYCCYDLRQAT